MDIVYVSVFCGILYSIDWSWDWRHISQNLTFALCLNIMYSLLTERECLQVSEQCCEVIGMATHMLDMKMREESSIGDGGREKER